MKLPKGTFDKKYKRQHGRCFYCGYLLENIKIEIDHIFPFSKYKDGCSDNLCLTCYSCNRSKGNKEVDEFKIILDSKGGLIREMFYFELIGIKTLKEGVVLWQND